jgi:hypothetical protein
MTKVRYECGCEIIWTASEPPRRCPAHALQRALEDGSMLGAWVRSFLRDLNRSKPRIGAGR